jgi:hypothetical protein
MAETSRQALEMIQYYMRSVAVRSGFAVLLAFFVGACTGPGFQERMNAFVSDAKYSWEPAEGKTNRMANFAGDARSHIEAYFMCNRAAAAVVYSQKGDPTSLAIAATSFCKTEYQNLERALIAAHAGRKIYARSANRPAIAMKALRAARKQALENNLADIVAFRATANPTPVPSEPHEPTIPKSGREI